MLLLKLLRQQRKLLPLLARLPLCVKSKYHCC